MSREALWPLVLYGIMLRLCFEKVFGVKVVGAILLTAHAIHDGFCHDCAWPMWMEPIAIALGAMLILLSHGAPRLVGIAIVTAHARQIAYKDDRYYWP